MQSEFLQNCPQCGDLVQDNTKRIIKDSCGHDKCRVCLLSDVDGCQQCLENDNFKYSDDKEVISSSVSDFSAINHYARVITYNNLHNDNLKDLSAPAKEEDIDDPPIFTQDVQVGIAIEESEKSNVSVSTRYRQKKLKTVSSKRSYKVISMPDHISVEGEPPIFTCNVCNSKFRTKGHVKYHAFCIGEKKPYCCDVCSKCFILKSQLHIHELIHLGKRPHVCKICGRAFRESGKLKRHLILHSDEKPHICDECGKRFKAISSLKLHRLTHSGEKPFCCKYCKMRFNNSSNLKKHMVSHSDDKTHMCEQCGKKFKQKWALTVHRRSHLHVRNYTCGVCDRAFINNKDLKRHELIHLETKMYSCGLCSISFRRKDNLGRHIKNAHPDKKAEIIKNVIHPKEKIEKPVVDNPNAINVIMASPIAKKKENSNTKTIPASRTCINGPLKLAFKTSAFKRNYNINRDCIFDSNSRGESSRSPNKNHYEDTENPPPPDSFQTKPNSPPRIFPSVYSTPNISVDEFYANRPHVMKNIKFKIPENYPSRNEELLKAIIPQMHSSANENECTRKGESESVCQSVLNGNHLNAAVDSENSEIPYTSENVSVAATSVIVNSSDQKNMHWRRRMSQNVVSEKA